MNSSQPAGDDSLAWQSREMAIAVFTVVMIAIHLVLRFAIGTSEYAWNVPLWLVLGFGGTPLVWELLRKIMRREFGSDLLAGISIVVSALLGEYLAGALVVLMLSGGEALEAYAVSSASSVLRALSKRMPAVAHRQIDSTVDDIPLSDVAIGDTVAVFPHETCPVDGTVVEGHGVMDESYLTGEPYMMSKAPGSAVLSGSINGESALIVKADKLAMDSRYAKIMEVMAKSEQQKPQMRRMADQLGAWYTPLAVAIGVAAWVATGDPVRFLAVMVVATPCPLLIAIPVAIIGSISLAARRAIIVRDPAALETADTCRTLIFDKTGTLTYGEPNLVEQLCVEESRGPEILCYVSSLERFSKHPLASAISKAAMESGCVVHGVSEVSEPPGQGLTGKVAGHKVEVTSRKKLLAIQPQLSDHLPQQAGGLECVILIDDQYAATYRFRDTPRPDGASFIQHLGPRHKINRTMLVSGDRPSEVQYLANQVGIHDVYASQSPEQKLEIVNAETAKANTIFVGDGINDAPALMAATVGVAFGQNSDVTTEAADVVVLDSSLQKIDEFLHISRRMRRIALQSAIGGMAISIVAMGVASAGYLPPVAGAILQEVIDVLAVLNALRVAIPPKSLIDFEKARPS
ncbi:ATPase, P-type (transporting), HAD superfamily, subfamily IC/heavy metal translocating P-type ATPase [Neorhodopirellula lusitana]|uniref:P-type Zn(2+) transporter n=2 Tax=Neorhodopirellula lusitana TaxID=445327 RepID=A0ABY1QE71_9BACT|nr:ATPase, P-type (transporting), HAD superfamily, subfamily IC/heavy metal translocating P-type ATPase [Neorhodopirellula lusitana]